MTLALISNNTTPQMIPYSTLNHIYLFSNELHWSITIDDEQKGIHDSGYRHIELVL